MAAISPGRFDRLPRKSKKQTTTTNTHRFEPFSKRIARLRIDPVHRVSQNESVQEDDHLSSTHFGQSLNHWAELNLSENFIDFVRKVKPLSESLPQILHHADQICELLLQHIGKKDLVSSEPLLSLLAHFAHDLGSRFEKYFAEAITQVLSVAAAHDASEVVEWSFSCLAWMLKFLSRLLVPNLRPLLTIMAPYLGRTRQKIYVTRFAAESVAFLVRKAGAFYQKNKSPLADIVSHVMEDLRRTPNEKEKQSYQIGLMSLFSESVRGIDGGLHTNSIDIVACLIDHAKDLGDTGRSCLEILEGVVISIIHETNADGFSPLGTLIRDTVRAVNDQSRPCDFAIAARLLMIMIGTRKGSRVSDWKASLDVLVHIAKTLAELPSLSCVILQDALTTIAMVFQYSTLNEVLPFQTKLLEIVASGPRSSYFLPFCLLTDQIGRDRFQSLVLPHLQEYIAKQWRHDQLGLCLLVRRLSVTGMHIGAGSHGCYMTGWNMIHDESIRTLCEDTLDLSQVSQDAVAQFAEDIGLFRNRKTSADHIELLRLKVFRALRREGDLDITTTQFWVRRGFKAYVRLAALNVQLDHSIWKAISNDPAPLSISPISLTALSEYLREIGMPDIDLSSARKLLTHLIDNLLTRGKRVKSLSIGLMQQILLQEKIQDLLSTIMQIMQTPYGHQTVRQILMLIRRLVILQKDVKGDSLLQKLIPYFCLGLLSSKSAPIASEVYSAISTMCEDPAVEEIICEAVFKSLQSPDTHLASDTVVDDQQVLLVQPTRYQCSNLQRVETLARGGFLLFDDAKENLERMLLEEEASSHNEQASISRLQALQVFKAIPQAAEKRSRFVIPVFLSIQPAQDYISLSIDSAASTSSHTMSPEVMVGDWSMPERKAFLELLGKFQNPKVIFKSQDVFDALLEYLTAGQFEIQKLALQALYTWKLPTLRKYEESLLRLTDEKTYRDELTNLFHADGESGSIQDDDRNELLPILLRLLYGQMISRSGSKSSSGAQEAKRKTTLRMLFKMHNDEISQFLDLSFGKLSVELDEDGRLKRKCLAVDVISIEKQHGLVRAAESMLETLQTQLAPFGERILSPVLFCLYRACQSLERTRPTVELPLFKTGTSTVRSIRRSALHCLCMIFTCCDDINWDTYLPSIFQCVVEPRLANFSVETAQGVSGLLQLFATWADHGARISFLNDYDESVLDRVADCLITPSTRDEVKIFILEQILLKLPQLAEETTTHQEKILSIVRSHIEYLLRILETLLAGKEKRKILDSAVSLLASLAPLVDSSVEVESLISAIVTLLEESSDRVSPKVKGNLLQAILHLLKRCEPDCESAARTRLRKVASALFNYFKDARSRIALAEIFAVLSLDDEQAREIASVCSRLNAVSSGKLDEIDYDARLQAFTDINAKPVGDISAGKWVPIIQNLIFFARSADDFAIRSNAVSALRRFIVDAVELHQPDFKALLQSIVLKALRKGVKVDSESVRADHVALFGLLIQKCPEWTEICDMRGLLAGNDEDASFFSNILHIQHHRRTRAMRRLSAEAERSVISSSNICNFFIPLLEKFIFDAKDDEGVRNLRGQTIPTLGSLLQHVGWSQFRAIFRRYKSYMNSKLESEKDIIKLLGVSADALVSSASSKAVTQDAVREDVPPMRQQTRLASSLPDMDTMSQELTTHFIPDLAAFIHQKDESQITSRIPVAVTTVKLLKILPQANIAQLLPPLLLDIAYILRSRSQDSRDVARRTLAEVTTILGPSCIHWILKELRTALARGYQLHVLSYTVHSILVSNTDHLKPGDLDHCLDGLVAVVMDDIFGVTGQEKDAEDYISKMREVKSSKSFDSMELLAKSTTIGHLVQLIRPLQALLTGNISSRQSKQVDELLCRIGIGLSRNSAAGSRDMLVFCYQVIQELYNGLEVPDEKQKTNHELNHERFLVQLPGANKSSTSRNSSCVYKLAKFALDVIRSTLSKHDDLLKPENVYGILPIVGDALVQAQEDVKISAMRTLCAIIKLPLPELDDNASLYVMEAVKVVKDSTHTSSEAAQAALKLIAAIVRERRSTQVRDSDIKYLLGRIIPDLEEPDRQGITFNLVKAVMARKIMLPEVYDVGKRIGMMMITNHDQSARDAARGIFVHFVLEFPQSKDRWSKQVKFLVKNLSYHYPEGRQSTMEAINMLLNKTGEVVAQELIAKIFIPLMLIMANDDSAECRRMAAALLSRCFEKADREQLRSLLDPLRSWVQQTENSALIKTGIQAFKVLFEVPEVKAEKEVPPLLSAIHQIIEESAHSEAGDLWETLYHSLQLFSKIHAVYPALTMAHQQARLWSKTRDLLTFPHPWVQSSSAGLIGIWFHDLVTTNGKIFLGALPLVGSHGLMLTADAQLDILKSSLRVLKRNWSSTDMSAQMVRILLFLGRCFNASNLTIEISQTHTITGVEDSDLDDETHDSDLENEATSNETKPLAITHLLTQLSTILRHEPRKLTSAALLPKRSAIQLLAALFPHTPTTTLSPLLAHHILPPLAHLTSPTLATPSTTDPTFPAAFLALTTSASELLDLLQKTVGSAAYITAMTEAQHLMRQKREARSVKRKMEVLLDPEAAAREKRRRGVKEKRRKEAKREGFRRGRLGL